MKCMLALTGMLIIALLQVGPDIQAKDVLYIGANGCTKACHKKEIDGDQRSVWRKSKHAEAFKTLGTEEAKKRAKEVGVSGSPEKARECLFCHTTGYGADAKMFKKGFKVEDGVQCEACHGAGDNYRKKKLMIKILGERGTDRKGKSPTAQENGLSFPDEETCKKCHVPEITVDGKIFKNPSHEDFNFKKDFEKMKHQVPDARRKSIAKGEIEEEEEEEAEE